MIARSWRGAVRTADAEAYAAYIDETGMKEYAAHARQPRRLDADPERSASSPSS